MSLIQVPYTNAMRLGQGFNSYTQQICVDDAVVVNSQRAENVISNDGTTMRIVADIAGKPSAWNRVKEVVEDSKASNVETSAAATDAASLDDATDASKAASPNHDATSKAGQPEPSPSNGKDATPTIQPAGDNSSLSSKDASSDEENISAAEVEEAKIAVDRSSSKQDEAVSKPGELGQVKQAQASASNDQVTDTQPAESEEVTASKNKLSSEVKSQVSSLEVNEDAAGKTAPLAKAVEDAPASEGKEKAKVPAGSTAVHDAQEKAVDSSTAQRRRIRSSSIGNEGEKPTKGEKAKSIPAKYQTAEIPQRAAKRDTRVPATSTALSRPKQLSEIEIEQAKLDKEEKLALMKEEKERLAEQRRFQHDMELKRRDEAVKRQQAEFKEQEKIRQEQREFEQKRREASRKAISDAAAQHSNALTLKQLDEIKAQNQFADRFSGMMENEEKYVFDATGPRGASQTVTYSSRFVDKLSDVTEDMCISGALSVKMAKIGGSGKGSFVDSNKFKESDLNFYISVKVVNHTLNFKDALEFNQMRSVGIGSENFNKIYGDSFISGFVEGGEFNAVVSMKVHNKAKLMDIKAEAKVALTAGPVDITAEANVGIARTNLEMNTETTIQVSWCGGGHIKPMEQPWNIQTIMQAAARFPSLVADCPQRTHAILTKYESLRSFNELKPAAYSPLQYENAQIYTNVLMDAFMSYKALYKDLGDKIDSIKSKILELEPWSDDGQPASSSSSEPNLAHTSLFAKAKATGNEERILAVTRYIAAVTAAADTTRFEASLAGLSDARKQIRRQMVNIVNEVDLIEKDPKVATDQDHDEPFQSPTLFETRIASTRLPESLKPKTDPLSGKRIMAKTQTEEELEDELKAQAEEEARIQPIYDAGMKLSKEETESLDAITKKTPDIGKHIRVSEAVPEPKLGTGVFFNNLEFVSPEWQVDEICVGLKQGAIALVQIRYDNGLVVKKGLPWSKLAAEESKPTNEEDENDDDAGLGQMFGREDADAATNERAKQIPKAVLGRFSLGERITSAAIEYGTRATTTGSTVTEAAVADVRVLSLCLYTNRGRRLLGQAARTESLGSGRFLKDGTEYSDIQTLYTDSPFATGTFKGFFGVVDPNPATGGVRRLGLIWGDSSSRDVSTSSQLSRTLPGSAPVYGADDLGADAAMRSAVKRAEEERDNAQAAYDRLADQSTVNLREANNRAVEVERHANARADAAEKKANENADAKIEASKQVRIRPDLLRNIQKPHQHFAHHSIVFSGEDFMVAPSAEPFISFENGVQVCFEHDAQLAVYQKSGSDRKMLWRNSRESFGNVRALNFHGAHDGNMCAWSHNNDILWQTQTTWGKGSTIVFSSESPWVQIKTPQTYSWNDATIWKAQ